MTIRTIIALGFATAGLYCIFTGILKLLFLSSYILNTFSILSSMQDTQLFKNTLMMLLLGLGEPLARLSGGILLFLFARSLAYLVSRRVGMLPDERIEHFELRKLLTVGIALLGLSLIAENAGGSLVFVIMLLKIPAESSSSGLSLLFRDSNFDPFCQNLLRTCACLCGLFALLNCGKIADWIIRRQGGFDKAGNISEGEPLI